MIQRIQTVFLFLLAIAVVSMLFLPLWSKVDATTGEEVVLTAWNINSYMPADAAEGTPVKSSMAIGLLAIAAAVVALYEIFQFKNRLTQMKLGLLNTLVLAAMLITTYYYAEFIAGPLVEAKEGSFEAGFYMPVLALLLNALANRFIRRDENLVRSVDRLR
jgi:hypothetical protein